MIPVEMPPEPPDFDARVRQPGHEHLQQKGHDPAQPPPTHDGFLRNADQGKADYWRRVRDALKKGYVNRCVYSCFYLSEEQIYAQDSFKHSIDHFKPVSQSPARLIYEWSNLRWAWELINIYKGDSIIPESHDPTQMTSNLVKLQRDKRGDWIVIPESSLTDLEQEKIDRTIRNLGLNNPKVKIMRNQCITHFLENKCQYSIELMKKYQPFIYRELRRLEWL